MAQSSSGTSSRRYVKDHDSGVNSRLGSCDSEWETKEALRQRELEEARARAAQMEKTMRWWSDCTANWREKWSKVRNERNKCREEIKLLRTKLEASVKEANSHKHDSQDLGQQNEQLRKELAQIQASLRQQGVLSHIGDSPLALSELLDLCKGPAEPAERDIEEYVLQGAVPKHAVELYEGSMDILERDIAKLVQEKVPDKVQTSPDADPVRVSMAMLNLGLKEAKALSSEAESRAEVLQLRARCDELVQARADVAKELADLKDQYQIEIMAAQADLLDEAANREAMDQRLNELRAELERLQGENAAEWGRRERLESERNGLDRENKQLKSEMRELAERLEFRRVRPVSAMESDRQLQQELMDMRHANAKMKKALTEKTTELTHALRRSEQYETEVKRVRARVEELKKELAAAQDEVDAATTTVRRLQRANEDLVEQLESANIQIEHFRNSSDAAPDLLPEVLDDKREDDDSKNSSASYEHPRG